MICPKCGFEQEERLDCRKCGVVFSKFYALHAAGKAANAEAAEAVPTQQAGPEEVPSFELSEVRQHLKELSQKVGEIEFDRAERARMRSEIKALDQKLQESIKNLSEGLTQLEERLEITSGHFDSQSLEKIASLGREIHEFHIEPLREKLDDLEARLKRIPDEPAQLADVRLQDFLRTLEARITGLETRVSSLSERQAGAVPPESGVTWDEALKDLEELRSSLQGVSLRYSEIGELKKNHLVLLSNMESIQQALEELKREPAKWASGSVTSLENEVHALRAEVHHGIKRIEALEAGSPKNDASALREELSAIRSFQSDEGEKTQSVLTALESKLDSRLASLSQLPGQLAALADDLKRVDAQYQPLANEVESLRDATKGALKKLSDLFAEVTTVGSEAKRASAQLHALEEKISSQAPPAPVEPAPPLETEVRAIREGLDQIRQFMNSLSQKL